MQPDVCYDYDGCYWSRLLAFVLLLLLLGISVMVQPIVLFSCLVQFLILGNDCIMF